MSRSNPSTARWTGVQHIGTLTLAVIAVGVAWRVVRSVAAFPIWGDERRR